MAISSFERNSHIGKMGRLAPTFSRDEHQCDNPRFSQVGEPGASFLIPSAESDEVEP